MGTAIATPGPCDLGSLSIWRAADRDVCFLRAINDCRGYPFYFNKDREPPQIEAEYTLYMYEALLAMKQACQELELTRADVEAIFSRNARRLIKSIPE